MRDDEPSKPAIPIEPMILRLLYYAAPTMLSRTSLVTRVRAISPPESRMGDVVAKTQDALAQLKQQGLCDVATDASGEQFVSLTEKGLLSLSGGLDQRLETWKASPVEISETAVYVGISGLDAMIPGGIPPRSIVLVRGPPGSGKTILAAQFLWYGITKFQENGLYLSFEVPKDDFFYQMRDVNMDFRHHDGSGFSFFDAAPIRLLATDSFIDIDSSGRAKLAIVALRDEIERRVREFKVRRIVIDTITSLSILYGEDVERRLCMLSFLEGLRRMGATSVLTAETSPKETIEPEDYLSDGLINLESRVANKVTVRCLTINKMRRGVDNQPRPYQITSHGIDVFPSESIL